MSLAFKAELVRTDPDGRDSDGRQQVVIVDQITHLGRSSTVRDHHARETPSALCDAKLAIRIEGRFVSRNHAVIYPPENDTDDWTLLDLNSLNGTRVNENEIQVNKKVPLPRGADFSLANVSFRFRPIRRDGNIHHALMIGHFGGNLRGTRADVEDLKRELEQRGFGEGNIETFFDGAATKRAIIDGLTRMQRIVSCDSVFVFYFSGHGGHDGSLYLGESDERLRPQDVFGLLENFRGQMLLILDGCYTSAFAEHPGVPAHTLIIGHEGKAYEGHSPSSLASASLASVRPADDIRGLTTRAIVKALRADPHRIDVRKLAEAIRLDPKIRQRQKVGVHGRTNVTLVSQRAPRNKV